MLPKIMQKLFENGGSGPSLRADILPVDGTTLTINAQNKLEAKTSVTLSDAVDSDSSETAASSRAVKTAFEKAAEAQTAAAQADAKADASGAAAAAAQNTADAALARADEALNSAGEHVPLSDAVDSDSSTTAASSRAVKIAYDAATAAQQTADEALNNHGGGCVTCSIPVIEGVDAVSIGSVASYTVSSVCGLQGAEITEFTWRLDEGDAQTAVAEDGQAILSLTLPPETEADSIHALTVIAHDSFGGASLPATRTFTAKKWNIAQPEVTSPVSGSVVAPDSMVITTSTFAVVGTDDTHVKSRYRISADRQGDSLLYDSGETADLLSHTATLSEPLSTGEAVYISVQHIGATLGASAWSEPVPVVPSWIATPSVTAPVADARITRFNLTIGTSAFACLSDKEDTHAATAYRVTSADGQTSYYEQESASNLTRLVIADVDIPDQTPIAVSARHKGAVLGWSAWSEPVMATIVPRIPMSEEKQFLSAGSHSFTVPDGITEVLVLVVGAGAGGVAGGLAGSNFSIGIGGAGGKGGGIVSAKMAVTPKSTIPITVGAVGFNGSQGTSSKFGSWIEATGGTISARGYGIIGLQNQGELICNLDSTPCSQYLSCESFREMALNQWKYNVEFASGSSGTNGSAHTSGDASSTIIASKTVGQAGGSGRLSTYGIGGNGGNGGNGASVETPGNNARGGNGGAGGRGGDGGGIGGNGGNGGRGGECYNYSKSASCKGGNGGSGGNGGVGAVGGNGGAGGLGGSIREYNAETWFASGGTGGAGGNGKMYGGNGGTGGNGGSGSIGYGGDEYNNWGDASGGHGGRGGNGGYGGNGGDGGNGGKQSHTNVLYTHNGNGGTGGNGGPGCVVVFY